MRLQKTQSKRYAYIDALRGVAILGVMIVHWGQQFPSLGTQVNLLTIKGAYGVQLFFVASALTLTMSTRNRSEGVLSFYTRRIFRIAPMFWLAIPFYLLVNGTGPRFWAPEGLTMFDVASTAVFLHGWWPTSINSVVPGGWSIAVEMMFYLIFPFIICRLNSFSAAVSAWVISLGTAALAVKLIAASGLLPEGYLTNTFYLLWLPSQLPVFAIGIAVYFAEQKFAVSPRMAECLLVKSVLLGAAVYYLSERRIGLDLLIPIVFGFFAFCLAKGGAKVIVCRPLTFLGKISFSAYLWHFSVLSLIANVGQGFAFAVAGLPVLVVVTAALANVTYRTIECPMITVGGWCAQRLQSRRLGAQAGDEPRAS